MAHCINCGTKNPDGAVFCLACGQTLYQEPRARALSAATKRARWLLPTGIIIGALVLILIVVLVGIPKGSLPDSSANRPKVPPLTTAVLTIISYDAAGNREAQGSGFILTSAGLAATNYHVLDGASKATAECCSGRRFEVSSIEGFDRDKDLVVFQLHEFGGEDSPHDLPVIPLDTSGDIAVGERVIAIGSPQGLENTVSDGIISAIRSYKTIRYLQITAPISPGSSGGPVLNGSGQAIGIATMQAQEGQNLNFAVSSEHLKPLLDEHLQYSLRQIQPSPQIQQKPGELTATNERDVNGPQEQQLGPFTGQLAGTVHNDTADLYAGFALFVQDMGGDLSGCLAVLRPLGGSGPLTGSVSGEDVTFVVTSADEKIMFTGKRSKGSIVGNYLVEKTAGEEETGEFKASRKRILHDSSKLDFTNCPTDADLASTK